MHADVHTVYTSSFADGLVPLSTSDMKLKHLIAELEGVKTWEKPKVELEQYPTSPEIAAHMLLNALEEGDIEDAAVADLGCGGGILGISAVSSTHVEFGGLESVC